MEERFVEANGIRFRTLVAGEGPLVVLLHGFPECAYSWRHQLEALAGEGFMVVAPDMRGYGGTERPSRVRDYDLDVLAADVVGLIEAFGQRRARVVGHDWGGAVAWHLAAIQPDAVEQLAVLNCPHPEVMLRVIYSSPRQLLRSWYMFFFQLPVIPESLLGFSTRTFARRAFRRSSARPEMFSDADLAVFAESMEGRAGLRGGINYYRASFRLSPRQLKARRSRWQEGLQVPSLLLWGTQDRFLGEELIEPHHELLDGGFEVVRVESSGHWIQQEEPERVNAVLIDYFGAQLG